MMNDEDKERFWEQLNSSYGQAEAVLGSDGYQAVLNNQRATAQGMLAHADRVRAVAGSIRITTIVVMLAAMPVIVWLWKWAITS